MYETYFNLTERPFASVPRADHYYPASVIDAARNNIARCIDRGEGVALVVGPSGSGKSLLCQVLAEQFLQRFQVALLASTYLDTRRSLLQAMLYELNRPYRGMDEGELRLSLVDYITLNDDCAGGMLLVVDEAHHLPLRLLDEIRALTNLTRAMQPAVRLVLAGNHVLEERFASPKLESFSQRIAARCYLEAFQREETQAYIWARIMVSGGGAPGVPACGSRVASELFPSESCRMVHKATGGVPRLINQVCDHVLLLAYAAGIKQIEPAHVEEAWADLQQLPTPWSAPVAASTSDGTSDSVIEFGGLEEDAAAEISPIAGKISAASDDDRAEETAAEAALAIADTSGDDEESQQLQEIQQLLADVQAEFQPAAPEGPEVELVFDAPHPFEEPFEEEEVIAERYAAAAQPASFAVAATLSPALVAEAAPLFDQVERRTGAAAMSAATAARVDPQPEPIPVPHERSRDACESPAAVPAENRPVRTVVPPPRKEFGRLFAGLRRGL